MEDLAFSLYYSCAQTSLVLVNESRYDSKRDRHNFFIYTGTARNTVAMLMLKGFLSLWEDSLVFRLMQKQLLTKTDDSDMGACPLGNEIERGV